MKVLRSYEIKRYRLIQNSTRFPDSDELFTPEFVSRISMNCEPGASGFSISGNFGCCNLPEALDELRQFLKVMETMYNV